MTIPQTPEHTHNTQFTTPTALMLDARLTPLERNGWQVLRMLRAPDGISSLASLGQLRRYLTSIPLGQKAGHETTWRVLVVLRLTGWISLVGQQRDPLTGHVLSEQYQVHDQAQRLPGPASLTRCCRSCCRRPRGTTTTRWRAWRHIFRRSWQRPRPAMTTPTMQADASGDVG
ncbi:Uncharacterised protein [Pseudomonas aeruginosa]|nr:Uncharacterised protein [Pseudomonas aeruginosa]